MTTSDLYGTSAVTAPQLRDRLTALLAIGFQERESSYLGIYFLGGDPRGEHFRILDNVHDDPDELPEPDFAAVSVLLEVNATTRPEALRAVLKRVPHLALLRSTAS